MQHQEHLSQPINPDAMYRAPACAHFFACGLSTWWSWSKRGKIRKGLKIGPKTTVWPGDYLIALRKQLIEEAEQLGR